MGKTKEEYSIHRGRFFVKEELLKKGRDRDVNGCSRFLCKAEGRKKKHGTDEIQGN